MGAAQGALTRRLRDRGWAGGALTARLGGRGLLSGDAQGQGRLSVRCSLELQGQRCHLQGFVAEAPSVPAGSLLVGTCRTRTNSRVPGSCQPWDPKGVSPRCHSGVGAQTGQPPGCLCCAVLLGWMVVAQLSPLLLQDIFSEPSSVLLLGTSTPCRGVPYRGSFLRGLEQIPALLPVAWRSKAGTATSP